MDLNQVKARELGCIYSVYSDLSKVRKSDLDEFGILGPDNIVKDIEELNNFEIVNFSKYKGAIKVDVKGNGLPCQDNYFLIEGEKNIDRCFPLLTSIYKKLNKNPDNVSKLFNALADVKGSKIDRGNLADAIEKLNHFVIVGLNKVADDIQVDVESYCSSRPGNYFLIKRESDFEDSFPLILSIYKKIVNNPCNRINFGLFSIKKKAYKNAGIALDYAISVVDF